MNINWQPLICIAHNVYSVLGLSDYFEKDEAYLKSAFDFTETLWIRQLDRMSEVKIVMLSEAPLFGNKQTYIYNPASPPTAFFYFNDLKALGCDIRDKKLSQRKQTKKTYLIEQMAEKGFIVLDLFPFALNPIDTAINYRRMSKSLYFHLLSETASLYLVPKIRLIQKKAEKLPVFVYRYKKLFQKTNNYVESLFAKIDIGFDGLKLESIHGENMSLNRRKLSEIYNSLCANPQD